MVVLPLLRRSSILVSVLPGGSSSPCASAVTSDAYFCRSVVSLRLLVHSSCMFVLPVHHHKVRDPWQAGTSRPNVRPLMVVSWHWRGDHAP